MSWQPNIFSPILFVAAIFAMAVSILCARRHSKPGAIYLSVAMAALSWWALSLGCEIAAGSNQWRVFWQSMSNIGVVITPIALSLFGLIFSNLVSADYIRKTLKWYTIYPALYLLIVLTNWLHHGIWSGFTTTTRGSLTMLVYDFTPLYVFLSISNVILMLAHTLLFLLGVIRYKHKFRMQSFLMLLASLLIILGNTVVIPARKVMFDASGLFFLIAITLVFINLLQYQLLDLVPVSPEYLDSSFSDAAVIIDLKGRILDLNGTAAAILGASASRLIGTSLRTRLQSLPHTSEEKGLTTKRLGTSSYIVNGEERFYELRVSSPDTLKGSVVYFADVTSNREMDTKLATERRRANQLINIANISTETLSLDEMMRNTLALTCQLSIARNGLLVLFNELGKPLHQMVYGVAIPETHCVAIADEVRLRQITIDSPDVTRNNLWLGVSEGDDPPEGSVIGLPLYYGKQISGALVLYHPQRDHFAQTDTTVLEAATRQMSLALGNALIIHGQRMVSDAQSTLFETLRALQRPMSITEAMNQVTTVINRRTGWPLVALLAYDPSGQAVVFTAAGRLAGAFKKRYRDNQQMKANGSSPLNVFNIEEYPSAVLLPLSGMPRHLLLIASDFPMAFDDHTRWLANSLGNVAGLVLRNAQLTTDTVIDRRRLSALVESIHDGIVMIGTDGKLLVISQQTLYLVGLPNTPDYWLSKPLPDVLMHIREQSPDFVRAMIREVRRTSSGDSSIATGEIQVGDTILSWTNLPVREKRMNLGRLFILHDVTEERQLEQMRDTLTHTMVHDLKSPLTGIHSSLLLLEARVKDTGNDELAIIDLAKRSNDRLLKLINSILDISRLESGSMPLNITTFPIAQLVGDIMLNQLSSARERKITLVNNIDNDLIMVNADRELIARVLENITSNALKFTPRDGLISVTSTVKQNKVTISIYNSGQGIPPEVKPRLFQKFVTGLQEGHGSGLGLAFCRMVMEAHRQTIWAESTPGEGATLSFTLPVIE